MESSEIKHLSAQVWWLAQSGLNIIDMMAVVITRSVQPLQQRMHPLWCYNEMNDATHYKRKGPANQKAMAAILADLFKGEEEDFVQLSIQEGCFGYNPVDWVSYDPLS